MCIFVFVCVSFFLFGVYALYQECVFNQECMFQEKPSPKAGSKEENEDVFTWKAKVSFLNFMALICCLC